MKRKKKPYRNKLTKEESVYIRNSFLKQILPVVQRLNWLIEKQRNEKKNNPSG